MQTKGSVPATGAVADALASHTRSLPSPLTFQ